MMGHRSKQFKLFPAANLEGLLPATNSYRTLEAKLDLSFVRDLVRDRYEELGRPSIDPVVFFKLQLVLFFEGLRSERELVRIAADRLSLRWYLGYDLDEPLPDHSSLTRIRDRYGLGVFRRFFETIVEQCRQAGLVWGDKLYFDATQVDANASLDSSATRFAVEAHLQRLFSGAGAEDAVQADLAKPEPAPLSAPLSNGTRTDLTEANTSRHEWHDRDGRPDRTIIRSHYRRRADFEASGTDPDAALMVRKKGGLHFGYHDHYAVDGGKDRIILDALVTPADVMDNTPMLDLLHRVRFRWRLHPKRAIADAKYGTIENIHALEEAGIRAYMPIPDFDKRTEYYGPSQFRYDPDADVYWCPQEQALPRYSAKNTEDGVMYRAEAAVCNSCPVKAACTPSKTGRSLRRSLFTPYLDRVKGYHATEAYRKAVRKRGVWVEPLFGEAKDWHGLRRFRLRGLWKVNCEGLFIAAGQNIKRWLSKTGWGRRQGPADSLALSRPAPFAVVGRPTPLWTRLSERPGLSSLLSEYRNYRFFNGLMDCTARCILRPERVR